MAEKLGPRSETVRGWVRSAEVDQGRRPGVTSDEQAELKRLKRENAELCRANAHLEVGSVFLRGGARPPIEEVIAFIDAHRDRVSAGLRWGIVPICRVLQIAPSTYHAAKSRPLSDRTVRDAELLPQIRKVWGDNLQVYGADKVWDQLNKEGIVVARCTVERLMRQIGIQGYRRGRSWVRTTESDGPNTGPLIWSIATSTPRHPTCCGSRT